MSTAWRRELEQLVEQTNTLLARPDFDVSVWEDYGARRAAMFTRLPALPAPTDAEENKQVGALIREILAQDVLLIQKAQTQLSSLRSELAALATSRRALHGYAALSSAAICQYDA